MKINSGCLVVVMALSSFFAQGQLPYKEVINNYKSFLIAQDTTPIDSVKHWCSSLKSNGEWASVDYLDKNSSSWKTSEHLNRVVKLSITYHRPSSIFYHDASVWGKIILATNHWVEKKYVNSNWWYNEIGIPQFWRDIITLNFEKFDKLELSNALALLAQHKLKATFTGANLVWSADLAMHYGIFTSDEGLVTKASKLIIDEVKISKNEGIRPDFSFHQHGARLQTHHYGASFLKDNIRLAYELKNTPWSFPESKIIILKDFLVEGWQWMERGIYLTPATLDRSVSRRGFLVQDLSPLLPYFIKLFPKGTVKDLETMLAVQQGATPSLSGFKYFPYADFATLQDKKFSFFLKTISSRTEVTERINGENQKGTFLNLGNTYFIRNGKEYFDLMPVWDWGKLPGTTNFKSAKTIKRLPFVGGVYAGTSGLAVMDFETESEK
jgi:chondroitin AC lyase